MDVGISKVDPLQLQQRSVYRLKRQVYRRVPRVFAEELSKIRDLAADAR